MSKNFVSFNIKAKKKCDADAMILHCENPKARAKSDNINFPKYTKYNISSDGIHDAYKHATERVEAIKGKKIQKNANHYLEGVLAFSEEEFRKDPKGFREKAPELIEAYGKKIAEKYGFEYLGFSLHFDEGHTDEENKNKLNIHAHVSFANYDFKTNKARFREIQQKYVSKRKVPNMHFVDMQNLAGEIFEPLGFKRGISKTITNKKNLDKEDFVNEKILEKQEEVKNLEDKIKDQEILIEHNQILIERQAGLLDRIGDKFKELKSDITSWIKSLSRQRYAMAETHAQKAAERLDKMKPGKIRSAVEYDINSIEKDVEVPERAKISTKRKKNAKIK